MRIWMAGEYIERIGISWFHEPCDDFVKGENL
jgi:hypothetical protein